MAKTKNGPFKLLEVVTADSLDQSVVTYIVANFEKTEGKKKSTEMIGLEPQHFFQCAGSFVL